MAILVIFALEIILKIYAFEFKVKLLFSKKLKKIYCKKFANFHINK